MVGENVRRYLHERGLTDETIEAFRLRSSEREDLYIPYINRLGNEYGHTIRRLDGGEPKYLREASFEASLFNIGSLYEDPIFITEGELDCISLAQVGAHAVGYHGTQSFQESWRWGFLGSTVYVVADGDQPGIAAATKIRRILRGVSEETRILQCPEGEDSNSLLVAGTLKEWLDVQIA